MSDELNRAEKAFQRQNIVSPSDAARKSAIQNAMMQFEVENQLKKENTNISQGIGFGARLRERGNKMLNVLLRRNPMNISHMNYKHLLAGGASFAVMALVVSNINILLPETPIVTDQVDPTIVEETRTGEVVKQDAKPDEAKEVVVAVNEASPKPLTEVAKVKKYSDVRAEAQDQDKTSAGSATIVQPVEAEITAAQAPSTVVSPAPAYLKKPSPMAGLKRARRDSRPAIGGIVGQSANVGLSQQPGFAGDVVRPKFEVQGRDKFSNVEDNPVKLASEDPVSTFSVDVDTASYAFIRSAINRGVLPQKNAVRIEEMINYFDYDYKAPSDRARPFNANVSIMPTPWNANSKLLRIGIKGYELPKGEAPRANLVFLIDTSGSMNAANKLPLLRNSFKLLLQSLKPDDTVSIVTYAGRAGVVLAPTKVADKHKILASLDRLHAGGSTAGAEGIRQAYQLAEQNLDKDGVNRVILATDGDFNVGISNPEELKSFIQRKQKSGVTLSILGFGRGNYNDALMQTLAQNGNGNAAYIDTLSEARKVLVEEAGSTLFTIAKDVKIQVEFNPALVGEYRLIGYETRKLKREDFNNDKVDAGDIGAGHTVTALYEITAKGVSGRLVDELRYKTNAAKKQPAADTNAQTANEYAFVKIRYKQPKSDTSELITIPVTAANEVTGDDVPKDANFAAAVAAFGQMLKGGKYTGKYSYDELIALAISAKGEDRFGYRAEFVNLVRLAKSAAALEPQK